MFINVGTITRRYRHIERHRFTPSPGVTAWAKDAREQFRPAWIREIATGAALCVFSPAPIVALGSIFESIWWAGDIGACIGTGLMLVIIAAGVYLFVHSGTLQNCYRRLLKEKNV